MSITKKLNRRTDNTMAKRKSSKGQIMIDKTIDRN
jgi:hypothetical protein